MNRNTKLKIYVIQKIKNITNFQRLKICLTINYYLNYIKKIFTKMFKTMRNEFS